MGNVTQRMVGKLSARVMRPDGNMVEYDYCIRVAMLMALHPDYLVIHCSIDPVPREGTQFKVMDIEERLRLGESYIMYPIPPQYKELFKAPPVQMDGMSGPRYLNIQLSLTRFMNSKKVKRTKRTRIFRRVRLTARSFLALLVRQKSSLKPDGGWVPLLDFGGDDQSFTSTSDTKGERKRPDLTVDSTVWRPDLDDIPESPQGLHT